MNPESIFLLVLGGLSILGSGYGIWCAWDADREFRNRKRTPETNWKRNPRVGMDEWDADFRRLSGEPEPDSWGRILEKRLRNLETGDHPGDDDVRRTSKDNRTRT